MKTWLGFVRYGVIFISYGISYFLLSNSYFFKSILNSTKSYMWTAIILNIVGILVISMIGWGAKNVVLATGIVCIVFCSPAVLSHSKLSERIFGSKPEIYLPQHVTGFLFMVVIILFIFGMRLKKIEDKASILISDGADQRGANNILKNNTSLFGIFSAVLMAISILTTFFGIILFDLDVGGVYVLIIAGTGIISMLGSIIYIYKKSKEG